MDQHEFQSPGEVHFFVGKLIAELRARGLDASALEKIQENAYSSGLEWAGDLGAAVRLVQRQKIADRQIGSDLERLMRFFNRTWPKF